jgi:hypothetical protein
MSNRRAISSTQRHSEPLRGHQRSSEALRGTQRHSKALRGNQRQSEAIRRTQTQSEALRGHSAALSGHRDPRRPSRTQIASAIIGGATAARAPVCCAIVVRTSPSLSPLTTLAPPRPCSPRARAAGWRDAGRPRQVQWQRRGQGLLRERPGAPDSRAIRGYSEGTQRALRGHAEAIRGTQRPSEGSQRPVSGTQKGHPRRSEGTQRHSQTIRGHSEAILGHHSQSAALSRTQWQSRGRRDPRRPRWPHRVLSVRRVRVRVRVFAALASDAA